VVELRINIRRQIHTMRPGNCTGLPGFCSIPSSQWSPRRPVPVDQMMVQSSEPVQSIKYCFRVDGTGGCSGLPVPWLQAVWFTALLVPPTRYQSTVDPYGDLRVVEEDVRLMVGRGSNPLLDAT